MVLNLLDKLREIQIGCDWNVNLEHVFLVCGLSHPRIWKKKEVFEQWQVLIVMLCVFVLKWDFQAGASFGIFLTLVMYIH